MSASPSSEAPRAAHLLGEWARLCFATLQASGVRDVWVSPGSRSTPFTWAAHHTPGMKLRVVVDERSAGFAALGHTRITGRPCALLCTSGSAAANYFPAIVEAAAAHLPLVVLTADRPLEVQHAAAAQTIDQVKLYGDHVRTYFDLGLPDAAPSALVGLQRAVAQAVAQAVGPVPGPVHVNLRARKPLEPVPPQSDSEHALSARVTQLLAHPVARHAPRSLLANDAVREAARSLSEAASVMLVVGPLPAFSERVASAIAKLSERLHAPVFAEAGSQVRFALAERETACPLLDWLLSVPERAERVRPDAVLCIGHTPTSSAFERWAATVPRRIVLAEHGFPDAIGGASLVASGDLEHGLTALAAALDAAPLACQRSYLEQVQAEHERCREIVRDVVSARTPLLAEGAAVKAVVEMLPDGAVLALGNSLPLRDVDAYVTDAADIRVLTQRGTNGIDGLVAGAIGSGIASRVPTLLLLGDVSLRHDLSSLALLPHVTAPLVVAVIDNAGGRIFDQLPVSKLYREDDATRELWLTPPRGDLSHAAAFFGMHYVAPTTLGGLREAVATALTETQATLLHVRVDPHSAQQLRQTILEALSRV